MITDRAAVRRILVVKLRAIGDVLLATGVIPNLRKAFPRAEIDFLTEKPAREVVEGNPDLHEVIVFDPATQSGAGLILAVRRRKYDLVIDLFGNPRSAIVTRLSRAQFRVGYRFGWRRRCYNIVVAPRGGEVHNSEFNLDAVRALGEKVLPAAPFFPLSDAAERFAEEFIAREGLAGKFVVALNPGGGWRSKRWKPEHLARLGTMIGQGDGARLLVIWGPGERERAGKLAASIGHGAHLLPATNLKQLASVLKRCSVLVTNDSGPMHIAAAVGTPVVAIFGPTRPELQGPLVDVREIVHHQALVCLGCNYTSCPIGNPCMEEVTPEQVYAAFKRVAGRSRAG